MSFWDMLAMGIEGSEKALFAALRAGIVFCAIIVFLEFFILRCRRRRKRDEDVDIE